MSEIIVKIMTDSIADMFTRIRNGYKAGHESVSIPYSKIKMELAKFLEKRGYIKEVARLGKKNRKIIDIVLVYKNDKPPFEKIRRISKPSRRVYVSYSEIYPVRGGRGINILSTPKGVLTGEEARKQKVGGELIGEVW